MKNILKIYLILIISISNAQIIPLEQWNGIEEDGKYYKDTNNVLNTFEGTWVLSENNQYLKIILIKKTYQSIAGFHHEDLMIGEMNYTYGGLDIINTLSNININYPNNHKHTISGNLILKTPNLLNCTDCDLNEKRLYLGLVTNVPGYMVVKKTTVNGQEAIKIFIQNEYWEENGVYVQPVIHGWFTLTKQ